MPVLEPPVKAPVKEPLEEIRDVPAPAHLPPLRGIPGLNDHLETDSPWATILYNDDVHTFHEVISALQKAIGCSIEQGFAIALEVHTKGGAVVHVGDQEECNKVATVLEEWRLNVKVEQV